MKLLALAAAIAVLVACSGEASEEVSPTPEPWIVTGMQDRNVGDDTVLSIDFTVPGGGIGTWERTLSRGSSDGIISGILNCFTAATIGRPLPTCALKGFGYLD